MIMMMIMMMMMIIIIIITTIMYVASRPALGPTQSPIRMGTESFPGVKRPGCGVDHPPPSSAEVRVEL